jgi:Zn-finger nucleic acid-binding protein
MALNCPQCAASMNEVTAEAALGYLIVLDQCAHCGGIWCDRWELYPLTAAAAARLDRADQEALWQPLTAAKDVLVCPRCCARLSRFRDPALPPDAHIERCPNCNGIWLNRGALRRVKQRANAAPALTEAQLDRLATRTSGTPVTSLSNAFDGTGEAEDTGDVGRELTVSAAWLVARALLRLLLRI